jgi:putative tricarboxylic transport membrane protein
MHQQASLPALVVAAVSLAASTVLALFFVTAPGDDALQARGGVGPGTWPTAMLAGIACCAAYILLRECVRRRTGSRPPRAAAPPVFDDRKTAIGIALLIAYAVAVPFAGFALSTFVFFAAWLYFGGLRKPLTIALVTIVGTTCLLYIFAGLSKLPFDRGVGVFDALTVTLYRLLVIY